MSCFSTCVFTKDRITDDKTGFLSFIHLNPGLFSFFHRKPLLAEVLPGALRPVGRAGQDWAWGGSPSLHSAGCPSLAQDSIVVLLGPPYLLLEASVFPSPYQFPSSSRPLGVSQATQAGSILPLACPTAQLLDLLNWITLRFPGWWRRLLDSWESFCSVGIAQPWANIPTFPLSHLECALLLVIQIVTTWRELLKIYLSKGEEWLYAECWPVMLLRFQSVLVDN